MNMSSRTLLSRLLMLETIRNPIQTFVVYDAAELARKRARYPSALIIYVTYEDGPSPEIAKAFRDAVDPDQY